jgi:hypothetical protein
MKKIGKEINERHMKKFLGKVNQTIEYWRWDYITNTHLVWDRVISTVGLASDLAIHERKN